MTASDFDSITMGAIMAAAALVIAALTIMDKLEARTERKRRKEREQKQDSAAENRLDDGVKIQLAVVVNTVERIEKGISLLQSGMDCRLNEHEKTLVAHGESIVEVRQLAKSAHKRLDDHGVGRPPNGGDQ